MKVYVGIDMAKDKFDYCAMDRESNILLRGSNRLNNTTEFNKFSETLKALNLHGTGIVIAMESTGIYHIPLYQHLSSSGYSVRILNGLEVRGMKRSRIRKTSNDTIDAESIAKYLMLTETKESYDFPKEILNLKELITAYDVINCKIRTTKNNIVRVLDLIFRGLSNIIDIDEDTINMLEKFKTPKEFIAADQKELENYVTSRKAEHIKKAAEISPEPVYSNKALAVELSSLIRILKILLDEKKNVEHSIEEEPASQNHVIRTIPGIGPITGSIILGKIGDIRRFENAEKLVAFVGMDPVIKESGKIRSARSISKRGDSLLRSAIYMSTLSAVRSNPVIHEFYHRKIDGGMPKQKALVAASRKQCHIIWSVWHNNRPFEIPEKFRTDRE